LRFSRAAAEIGMAARKLLIVSLLVSVFIGGDCKFTADDRRLGSGAGPPTVSPTAPKVSAPAVPERAKTAEKVYGPFDVVVLADIDITTVAAIAAPDINPQLCRYLSLHNKKTVAARKELKQTIDFVLNSLNPRFHRLVKTAVVPAGDDPIAVRVNLADYNIDPAAWDELAERGSGPNPLPDPYFHIFETRAIDVFKEEAFEEKKHWAGGMHNGKHLPPGDYVFTGTRKVKTGTKTDRVFSHAPWLAMEAQLEGRGTVIADLAAKTATNSPILLGQWFVTYATWTPAYYRLIGLTKKKTADGQLHFLESDLEQLAKADLKRADEEIIAAVADTKIVTLHNRILQRYPTVAGLTGGSYWRSKDTDSGLGDEDYMANVHTFKNPKIKAQEIIFSGRNGLNFYALTDNKGNLIDVAAPTIARHGDVIPTKWDDKQIYPGRNCMLCHSVGQLPIKCKVRELASGQFGLLLADKDTPGLHQQIYEAFSPHLDYVITHDNAKYAAAVKALTGLDAKANGAQYENQIWDYYDSFVAPDKAAAEAGWDTGEMLAALRAGINIHYTSSSLIRAPAQDVSRTPWEAAGYRAMMEYLTAWKLDQE